MAIVYDKCDTSFTLRGKRAVSEWIKRCVLAEGRVVGDIVIVFCSDSYILETNRQYLNHDYYTDIITFDYSQDEILSGDLIISVDTVRSNAKEYGVTFHVELMRVIIHGVMHLAGYKDKSEEEAVVMRSKEDAALALLEE